MRIKASSRTVSQDFAQAYEEYADRIFRHCAFRCFCRERGKELMQETFMKVWDYIASGKDIDNVQAFLYRTANNLIVDDVRREKKRQEVSLEALEEEGFDVTDEHHIDLVSKLDGEKVIAVLATIGEPYASVLTMRFVDGLPPKVIANLIGETANTVSVRVTRGIEKLRSILVQYG